MSRSGEITLEWGDGEHHFRLAWKQLVAIQEECDAGPFWVLGRLGDGSWRMSDIEAPIRHGLIGGGLEPPAASRLVRVYVQERPLAENLLTARTILAAAVYGIPDDEPGKSEAASQNAEGLSPEVS